MAREFFKNYPNTTTPLSAPRLNGLLDGDEAMGNIVADSIKSKNLFGGFGFRRNTNGLTFNYNGDGTITVNGTSTATAYSMTSSENVLITLTAGTYTVSGGLSNIVVQITDASGNNIAETTSTVFSATFTLSATTQVIVRLRITSENTFSNNIISVLLEKGNKVTDFASYQGIGYVSGSNENGNYIKYDDGTLIVWGQKNIGTVAFSSSWGNIYISSAQTAITYPISFINAPLYRNLTPISGTGLYFVSNTNGSYATNTSSYYLIRANSSSVENVIIGFYAIGRWK